jgi:hypothetical protein
MQNPRGGIIIALVDRNNPVRACDSTALCARAAAGWIACITPERLVETGERTSALTLHHARYFKQALLENPAASAAQLSPTTTPSSNNPH